MTDLFRKRGNEEPGGVGGGLILLSVPGSFLTSPPLSLGNSILGRKSLCKTCNNQRRLSSRCASDGRQKTSFLLGVYSIPSRRLGRLADVECAIKC